MSSAASCSGVSFASCAGSSFEVGTVDVFGSVGDAEELEELSDDEVWAVARPGPKKAAPTPTPARSEPATRAAATGLFMGANLTTIPGSQPGASA